IAPKKPCQLPANLTIAPSDCESLAGSVKPLRRGIAAFMLSNCRTTEAPHCQSSRGGCTMGHIVKRNRRALVALLVAMATTGLALAQQATMVGTLDGHTDPV